MATTSAMHQTTGWTVNDATFAARLALVRMRMGWNMKEAARECGLNAQTWRLWEIDGITPRDQVKVAKQISTRTGCDYLWLLLGPDRGDGGGGVNEHYRPLSERVIARVGEDRARANGRVLNVSTQPGSSGQPRRRRPRLVGPSSRAELTRV